MQISRNAQISKRWLCHSYTQQITSLSVFGEFYHTALYQNFKPYSLLKKVGREVTLATVGQEHNHVLACTSGTTHNF